MFVVQ